MARLKLFSAALFAAAVFTVPAMAREGVAARHLAEDAYVTTAPYPAYGVSPYAAYAYRYGCIPGPRVGAFATQPWDNVPTCPPGPMAPY